MVLAPYQSIPTVMADFQSRVQKMVKLNRHSMIETRPVLDLINDPVWNRQTPPDIKDGDRIFRHHGVELSYRACQKALEESCISVDQLTHIVAVTATNTGCPGLDHLVAEKLGMSSTAERILLGGAGCAGGMAAIRVAADTALSSSFREKPARLLVIACELSSPQIRAELEASSAEQKSRIGPILFSDGAAAVVVCNSLALRPEIPRVFLLDDWTTAIAPQSSEDVTVNVDGLGFVVELSKRVPDLAAGSVSQPFQRLSSFNGASKDPKDYDWALHPGGYSIIREVQAALDLSDNSLRASFDVYKTKGNTASVSVIAVMDRLRRMGPGKENVVACAFGPGMRVEMAFLRRAQDPRAQ